MKPSRIFLWIILPLITVLGPASAQVPADLYPAHSSSDQIVKHTAYALCYSEPHEQACWVIYKISGDQLAGGIERTDNFRADPNVTTGSATPNDYRNSGYDRGHLAPAADFTWSAVAMSESFFMSNMSPQVPGFNRGIWKRLEDQVRAWAAENEEVYVVTGPVLVDNLPTIGANKVSVPKHYYKVILDLKEPELKGIGFIMPNGSSSEPLQSFAVSIDSVEKFTGLDFFPGLPDVLEDDIESRVSVSWFGEIPTVAGIGGVLAVIPAKTSEKDTLTKGEFVGSAKSDKFHRKDCRYAGQISPANLVTWTTAEEALKVGRVPCKVCSPAGSTSAITKEQPKQKPASDDVTVYVTKTGTKYHRAGCRSLKSSIPMKLSDAKKRYSPCSVCNPPK